MVFENCNSWNAIQKNKQLWTSLCIGSDKFTWDPNLSPETFFYLWISSFIEIDLSFQVQAFFAKHKSGKKIANSSVSIPGNVGSPNIGLSHYNNNNYFNEREGLHFIRFHWLFYCPWLLTCALHRLFQTLEPPPIVGQDVGPTLETLDPVESQLAEIVAVDGHDLAVPLTAAVDPVCVRVLLGFGVPGDLGGGRRGAKQESEEDLRKAQDE